MRRVLLLLILALTATGLALVWMGGAAADAPGWRKALSLVHIWGGLFFLVVFPLYAWDHVRANRAWLRVWAGVTLSGSVQLASAGLLILSGLVILAYGEVAWALLRDAHHWLTYLLAAALATHFLSPKRPG